MITQPIIPDQDTRYAKAKLIPAMSSGNGCTIVTWCGEIELTKTESAILAEAVEKILNYRMKHNPTQEA